MMPPQNIDAEQSVIGSMLISTEVVPEIRAILSPSDFYKPSHGTIYETIIKMHDNNIPTDMVTISEELRKTDKLEEVGGVTYVATLTTVTPTSANAIHYAKIVKNKSISRQLIEMSRVITQKALNDENPQELIQEAQQKIFNLSTKTKNKGGLVGVYELTVDIVDEISSRTPESGLVGISTGFAKLDLWTAGFQKGQLIIVAARPAMGKTSFAIQLGINAAINHKKHVAIFSLETKKHKLIEKMLINQGVLDAQKVRLGLLNDEDIKHLAEAANLVSQSSTYIADDTRITVDDMITECRKLKMTKGLDMVIIDYLQLIEPKTKSQRKDVEIGDISRSLKILAMELDVPVIALSQLSRAVESLPDKKPGLSHLRESGSLEQDADTVMFLYRPEYYFPDDVNVRGRAEILLAKQREGPVGTVSVVFLKQSTKFVDIEGSVVNE